jgi:type VI secretion system protein
MPLTLEVVGQKAAQMGSEARKVFQAGGTIGRLRDNDWVFPDEYISGRHAKISFANGSFLIEDTSTNGVFINSPQNRMTRGQPYALRHGDTVYIDDYEVRVTLSAETSAAAGYSPLAGFASSAAPAPLIPEDPFFDIATGSLGAPNDTDPLRLLGLQDARALPPGPSAASLANQSPMSQHYRPPAAPPPPPPPAAPSRSAPAGSGMIPDDYDPFAADDAPMPVRTPPRAAPAPPPRPVAPSPEPVPKTPPPQTSPPTMVTSPLVVPRPAARPAPSEPPSVPPPPPVRPTNIPGRSAGASGNPASVPNAALAPGMGAVPRSGAAPSAAPGAGAGASPSRPSAPFPQALPSEPSTGITGERRVPGGGSGDLDFATLLAAAGIDAARVTPELSAQFGQILRVVVAGLMDVLRARERIKDEFRMRMTTFKQADNNPLKFSANVEDALHNLLVKRNAAYLGPVEAFEDAFQDLRNHQMAMLAGMRVAYDAMLKEFQPEQLQEEFDRHLKGGSFLSGPAKMKYWELYRNRFHDMVKDADSSFRNLFGDEFAKAYEEQLVRLKTLNRADRR